MKRTNAVECSRRSSSSNRPEAAVLTSFFSLAAFIVALVRVALAQALTVEFSVEPQDTVVQSGNSAVLDCVVKYSEPLISHVVTQWLDQDQQALTFIGDPFRSQLTNGSLYISSVLEEHGLTGAYQCKASLPGGASIVSRAAHLSLATLGGFSQEPQDNTVLLGQKAHFACRVNASPAARIRWLKDERPMQIEEMRMTALPSGALEIDEVKESDQGIYRCNASGPNQHALSAKAHLVISEEGEQDDTYPNSPPRFIGLPVAQVVTEGEVVTLDCAANGNPNPNIKWLKDGYNIDLADLDSRFSLIGSSSSLRIANVQEQDAGTYQCRAENKEDSLDASAMIRVQVPPRFITRPKVQVEAVHKDVEFECAVYGKPEPKVYWLKNGEQINTNEYYQIVNGSNLKIMGLMKSDAGIFQCVAANAAGNVQAAASLVVQDSVHASPSKKLMRRKKVNKLSQLDTSRTLFGNLRPDTPALGEVEFGFTNSFASGSFLHSSYDPKSVLTSLQPELAEDADGNAFTDTSLPTSKPLLAADDESHFDVSLGPPQDLRAPVVKARFVVLSWKPPAANVDDIVTYSVYYRQEGSERERAQNTTRSKLEEINVGSLQPDKVYHFRVVACSRAGSGATSETLTVTTQSEENVPSAPRDFDAYATSTRSIHVSWRAPEVPNGPILRYKVYYMETQQSVEYNAETSSHDFDIISLAVFSKYNVWAVAINSNGAGAASEDKTVQTFSDAPSEPPYNVTLEPSSSTSVLVRWEPPPVEGQNGVITGYKLRYRVAGKKGGNTITTAANTRMHALNDLERATRYQVKLWAINVNGTGPPTDWCDIETYENDLDESRVPDEPGPLRVRPVADRIYVMWSPPKDQSIKIRNFILGWGKGIPDRYTHELDEKLRQFVIERLEPNSDYVISLRASNSVGAGAPVYANVRTREEPPPEVVSPLTPPIGLKAQILSATSVVLYWVDTTLSKNQLVRDNRRYIVEYTYHVGKVPKTRYANVTNLNVMIDDLRPATLYEFMVKVVNGRRESPWSMVVTNATWEVAPAAPPRDLSARLVEGNTQLVEIAWQPPKSGYVTGYIIMYTTDSSRKDREWSVQAVKGDKHKFVLTDLKPSTTYHFKIQARNNRGNGPFSSTVQHRTGENFVDHSSGSPLDQESKPLFNNTTLVILLIVGLAVLLMTALFVAVILCRRRAQNHTSPDRSKKGYQKGNQNIKPPDLWIHHDQMELKNLDKAQNNDGASSSGAVTLPRSVGNNEYDDRDGHHQTNSLDKRTYIPNYMGLSPDGKYAMKPKPITFPIDTKPPKEPIATATPINAATETTPNRPAYPRTQYSISRGAIVMDPQSQQLENPYTTHPNFDNSGPYINSGPPSVAHVPPTGYAPGMGILAESQAGKRLPTAGHPLKSFTVPAPPPISAPGTPQPKHIVTSSPPLIVRPNASPFKKAPSSTGSGSLSISSTPPSRIASIPPPHTADEIQRLQPSHSTEELNQEMANLEGLMLTLNAITANEFEC